jgi:hypothetical protein
LSGFRIGDKSMGGAFYKMRDPAVGPSVRRLSDP